MNNVWDELLRMQEEMDTLFGQLYSSDKPRLKGPENAIAGYRKPWTELHETDKDFVLHLEVPGVDKKDIKLNVTKDFIEVKVEKRQNSEKGDKKSGYYQMRSFYSGFYNKIPLPQNANPDKAEANYKDGLLEVKIGKLKQLDRKSREITVR